MMIDICLPVYNEQNILQKNTLHIFEFCKKQNWPFDWQIVIIVNGSVDKSLQIAKELAGNYLQIIAVNYEASGKGNAIKEYGLISKADIMVYMDIDLSTDLKDLPELIEQITKHDYDLAIGSRLMPGSITKRSFLRELISRSYNLLSRILLNNNISDMQCGFKAVRITVFHKVAAYIQDTKWFFDTELVVFTKLLNYAIKEVPVNWSENRYEKRKSTIRLGKDSCQLLISLIKLKKRLSKID
ncbi:MAG: glycosyltransferase [bacterium]